MLKIAALVDAVATAHENHCLRRSEHVFATDWAVAIRRALDAFMGFSD